MQAATFGQTQNPCVKGQSCQDGTGLHEIQGARHC